MQFIDMHCDTLLECYRQKEPLRENSLHIDLEKLRKGGSLMQFFAIFLVSGEEAKEENISLNPYELFSEVADLYERELVTNSNIIAPVRTFSEFEKNRSEGKMSALLTVEDAGALEGDFERLQMFYDRGVRLMTLLWNYENCIGFPQSSIAAEHSKGLKAFGIELVERMNDIGMIIDVSHMSEGGFYDVAKYSKKPFTASHSCARKLCNHSRNLTDEQLRCIADKGGIVGVNFNADFLRENVGVSTADDIAAHLAHMVNIMGDECVALGSDFDGIDCELEIKSYEHYSKLLPKLEKIFSQETIEKICYKNVIRLLKENI